MALWPLVASSTLGPGEVPEQCPDQCCGNDLDQVVFAREWGSGPGLPPSPARQRGLLPVGLPERKAPSSSNISPHRCQIPPPHTSTHRPSRRTDPAGFHQSLSQRDLRWGAKRKKAEWVLKFIAKDISHTDRVLGCGTGPQPLP